MCIKLAPGPDGKPQYPAGTMIYLDGPPPTRTPKDKIWRYCFQCGKVGQFLLCVNCGRHFCLGCCDWDEPAYGEFGGGVVEPGGPVHRGCL